MKVAADDRVYDRTMAATPNCEGMGW